MSTILTKKAILKSNETNEFTHSKCVLTISVGQPNHEGDKFKAAVLATNKFSACIIMVCDTLQRYTMKISSSLNIDELHKESSILGDEWIERNLSAIEQLKIPYQLSKWDSWINNPKYHEKKPFISKLYLTDCIFKEKVDSTALGFLERNLHKILVSKETALHLSKDYLLEECVVMLLLAEQGYGFEIYPNQRNEALDYIYKQVISQTNEKLMRAVSIKFKNLSLNNLVEKDLIQI